MLSLLNFTIAMFDLALLFYVLSTPAGNAGGSQWRLLFLAVLLGGMAYDNLVIASGYWLIEQPWFYGVSMARFYFHVLSLPFLTLFTWSIIRDSGLALGQSRLFLMVCAAMTLGALAYGISQELWGLQLVENSQFGVRRMSNAHGSAPVATILTNLFTILLAGYVWRKSGWKVLFLGAVFIFIVNGATAGQKWGFMAGNLAEVVFALSLIASHLHVSATAAVNRQQVLA
ncbi:hypothetical protein [Rheinheimera sp.]|uniref:hypothetical protein n=1 Tax=Rheinheimera sp. TaxID=1869214 RepID=UPI00307D40B1